MGRTVRAGRSGEAILFVAPRERGMLRAIERATRQPIEAMALPSVEAVNEQRVATFLDRIDTALESSDLPLFRELVERSASAHKRSEERRVGKEGVRQWQRRGQPE